ncbi:MAG: cobyrinate a,c-diamide synthase [Ardenticatenia bacterium]|nr:MAG: cobyrinate a,c-diamide synthase [Ardenticatenia bacterium]
MPMELDIPRLVIAAPASGSGKSTVASGLMAALRAAGAIVQGFKVGPDYIDPGYHTAATGRPSRNLDTWMVPASAVLDSFARAVAGAHFAVIEGVMGLFDGYHGRGEEGSTAEVAKLLQAPVVLVLDVAKMARSAAAMALGYQQYDPGLHLAGVICNNVGSARHARWVREAVEGIGLAVLGCIPRSPALHIPERHLGLYTAVERQAAVQAFLRDATTLIRQEVDLERIRAIAQAAPPLPIPARELTPAPNTTEVHIAVAYDEAFCFYYADNFDLLRQAGASLTFFSPLRSPRLPEGICGLYLGGGYPELYAAQLAENRRLLQEIRAAAEADMPIYAECGGLMMLTASITDHDNRTYPMAGVLPGRTRMRQQLVMGYRIATASRSTLLQPRGVQVRGHEFHYSDWVDLPDEVPFAYDAVTLQGEKPHQEGFARGNLLASYIHLHFAARPEMVARWLERCHEWQRRGNT